MQDSLPSGARAIMGSREEPGDSLDHFPTPPWATRALVDVVLPHLGVSVLHSVWEPACGEGHMAEVLREYCSEVMATDIHDYGYGDVRDFLSADEHLWAWSPDWIITNPPFGDSAIQFVQRARSISDNVAMFFRSQWAVEGVKRYEQLFRNSPPTLCAFFTERVPLCKGRWEPDGSTATAYCWLVWMRGREQRPPFWIPPGQRVGLTRPDDRDRFTAHPVIKRPSASDLDIPYFLRRDAHNVAPFMAPGALSPTRHGAPVTAAVEPAKAPAAFSFSKTGVSGSAPSATPSPAGSACGSAGVALEEDTAE